MPAGALITGSVWEEWELGESDEQTRVGGSVLGIRGNDHEKRGVVINLQEVRRAVWTLEEEMFDGRFSNETRLANANANAPKALNTTTWPTRPNAHHDLSCSLLCYSPASGRGGSPREEGQRRSRSG